MEAVVELLDSSEASGGEEEGGEGETLLALEVRPREASRTSSDATTALPRSSSSSFASDKGLRDENSPSSSSRMNRLHEAPKKLERRETASPTLSRTTPKSYELHVNPHTGAHYLFPRAVRVPNSEMEWTNLIRSNVIVHVNVSSTTTTTSRKETSSTSVSDTSSYAKGAKNASSRESANNSSPPNAQPPRASRIKAQCAFNQPLVDKMVSLVENTQTWNEGANDHKKLVLRRAMYSIRDHPAEIRSLAALKSLKGIGDWVSQRLAPTLNSMLGLEDATFNGESPVHTNAMRGAGVVVDKPPMKKRTKKPRRANLDERDDDDDEDDHDIEPEAQEASSSEEVHHHAKRRRQRKTQTVTALSSMSSSQSDALATSEEGEDDGEEEEVENARRDDPMMTSVDGDDDGRRTESPPLSSSYELVFLVDNREIGRNDRLYFYNALRNEGVPCEMRNLALGDYLMVLRSRLDPKEPEWLQDFVVERKTANDLAVSIVDGRYQEQKHRLKTCGLKNVIYLVEGELSSQSVLASGSGMLALRTALAETRAHGLSVHTTRSREDTVRYLVSVHRAMSDYATFPPARTRPYASFHHPKAGPQTVREVLQAMLLQVPSCGADKAMAISQLYPTPARLAEAYFTPPPPVAPDASSRGRVKTKTEWDRRAELLQDVVVGRLKRRVGPEVSTRVAKIVCMREYTVAGGSSSSSRRSDGDERE